MCCLIADLLPKRRNAQNHFLLFAFGAILDVFFRYKRLHFDGCIPYRPPFKRRLLSLPGNKKSTVFLRCFSLAQKLFHYCNNINRVFTQLFDFTYSIYSNSALNFSLKSDKDFIAPRLLYSKFWVRLSQVISPSR